MLAYDNMVKSEQLNIIGYIDARKKENVNNVARLVVTTHSNEFSTLIFSLCVCMAAENIFSTCVCSKYTHFQPLHLYPAGGSFFSF